MSIWRILTVVIVTLMNHYQECCNKSQNLGDGVKLPKAPPPPCVAVSYFVLVAYGL